MRATLFTIAGLLALGQCAGGESAVKAPAPGVRALTDLLDVIVDAGDFQQPVPLRYALELLKRQLAAKGKELPLTVNVEAFKEENPDAPSIYDSQVQFPEFPRKMKAATALRTILQQVIPPNARYLVHPSHIEITTFERASIGSQLGQHVRIRFQRRSLSDALEDLYELTGVSVVLDTRAGRLAQIPITANVRDGTSLGTVLLLISEMAGLKLLVGDNILYITTPAHARQFLLERALNPYGLAYFSPPPTGRRIEAQ